MFKYWYKIMCYFGAIDYNKNELSICDIILSSFKTFCMLLAITLICSFLLWITICGITYPLIKLGVIIPLISDLKLDVIVVPAFMFYFLNISIILIIFFTRKRQEDSEPSMLYLAYKSFKDKVCFFVDVSKYK